MKALVMRATGQRKKVRPFSEYISLKQTLKDAKLAGLSVSEYLERKHLAGGRSALDQTMDGLDSLGLFNSRIGRICEIGPGSGRYLERIKQRCCPRSYEIYETSSEWRSWLVERYGVTTRSGNGRTLAATESGSMDLVHAHKLFPGLPFLATASYLQEMARVVSENGWVVFDILTESCLAAEWTKAWFNADPWGWSWSPHMIAKDFAIEVFAESGVSFVGSFQVPLFPAITECMVFRKIQRGLPPRET